MSGCLLSLLEVIVDYLSVLIIDPLTWIPGEQSEIDSGDQSVIEPDEQSEAKPGESRRAVNSSAILVKAISAGCTLFYSIEEALQQCQ